MAKEKYVWTGKANAVTIWQTPNKDRTLVDFDDHLTGKPLNKGYYVIKNVKVTVEVVKEKKGVKNRCRKKNHR